MFEKLNVLHWR